MRRIPAALLSLALTASLAAPAASAASGSSLPELDGHWSQAAFERWHAYGTVLFARALGIRPTENPDLSGFVDGDKAADWSAGYVHAMAEDGIIQGIGNQTLALDADITRGSVVTVLDNAVAEYAVEDGAVIDHDVDGILLVAADNVTVDSAAVEGSLILAPKAGEDASLTVRDSTVERELWLAADGASLSLEGATRVSRLSVDGADSAVAVAADAFVDTLTARAAWTTRVPSPRLRCRQTAW